MDLVIRVLVLLLLPIILKGIWEVIFRPNKDVDKSVFRTVFSAVFSMSSSAFFIIQTTILTFQSSFISIIFASLCFILALLCLIPTISFINCRIFYNDNEFIVRSFFAIKRRYTYDQITAIVTKDASYLSRDFLIYIGKRKVKITRFSNGANRFISHAKKQYSAMNNGLCIRQISKTKYDIFNGNVRNPSTHIFVCVLCFIVAIAFTITVFFIAPPVYTADNTIEQQVTFIKYNTWINELKLISDKGDTYLFHITSLPRGSNEIKALCNGTDVVTVYSTKNSISRHAHDYAVRALSYNGEYLYSFEDNYRFEHRMWSYLVILSVTLSVLQTVNFIGSIIVGRHPEKYSKTVKRLFFKKWALNKNIVHKK